jgi:hypothetical protein
MKTQPTGSSGAPLFDISGTVLQFLVTPAEISQAFAMMRSIVSPGVVPLHSHADPEVLFIKHALRNNSQTPTAVLLTSTRDMYRFFPELGKPFYPGPPAVLPDT